MDKLSKLTSLVYALILVIGGFFAYTKVQSTVSLITGVASGILVLLGCKFGNNNPKAGYLYVSTISLILAGFFAYRYSLTHAFMPGGLMLILSVVNLVVVGLSFMKAQKS